VCWTNYQMALANRGSAWNPSPSFSRGPLYPRYRTSIPSYNYRTYSRRAMPSYNPTARYSRAPVYQNRRVHRPGGVFYDPPR
jgi:hypothetical protein